jgi:ribonuclease-3 family protein
VAGIAAADEAALLAVKGSGRRWRSGCARKLGGLDMSELLGERSVRTLAWLGDAEFEREVRMRLARRGDYPTDRLHAMKALVVCAEAQAELLAAIEAGLDEVEAGVVRRARNLSHKAGGRGVRSVRDYRAATALEALVGALVLLGGRPGASGWRRW